jgi:hypothetical protein
MIATEERGHELQSRGMLFSFKSKRGVGQPEMMVELLIFDCLVLCREDIMECLGVAKVQLKNGLVNLSTILFKR